MIQSNFQSAVVDTSAAMSMPQTQDTLANFETDALPHLNELYRTAVRLLREPAKASDAVQDTYLRAWKSFNRYQAGTNCKAWLFQILFNVVRHEWRNSLRWVFVEPTDSHFKPVAPASGVLELTDKAILAALDSIPMQFRQIVLLVDVEEFTYAEASEILKVPVGTVMSRLSRGRTLLRQQLSTVAKSYGITKLN